MAASRTALAFAVLAVTALPAAAPALSQSAASWAKRGNDAEFREDYDAAFEAYRQAHLLKPKDIRYQTKFERLRFAAAAAHVDRGRVLRQSGDLNGAITEFERALSIDGSNQTAQQEITATERELSTAPGAVLQQQAPLGPSAAVASVASPIDLKPISTDTITLHMVGDTKDIYQAIGKATGLNVIFDPDYTSRRVPVDLVSVSWADALRIVGTLSGTFWKPVTNNTIFVAQNSVTKRNDLNSMAVQTFYLSNAATQADQNELLTALRNVLEPTTKIFLVPSQNALVLRATPDQLLLTETLLNNLDRARSEVVVDVAVLEVNRDRMRNLGISLPQSFSVTPQVNTTTTTGTGTTTGTTTTGSTTTNGTTTLNQLYNFNANNIGLTLGTATLNALLNDTDTRVLQNPRLRATDGQRAQLKIGSRIPVATGSFSSGVAASAVSGLVNTQFSYIDVGVNIDITPTVHQDREITLKMKLEVSSQLAPVNISGVNEPVIAQRVVEQTIQLKEGEPSILAGILSRSETRTLTGTPGLSDLPILKKFFSSNNTERAQDEVVFLLIPHIVREPLVTRLQTRAIDTGTGASIELRRDPNAVPEPVDNSALVTTGAFQRAYNNGNVTAAKAASALIGQVGNESANAARAAANMQSGQPTPNMAIAQAGADPAQSGVQPGAQPGGQPLNFSIVPANSTQSVGSTFQVSVNVTGARDLYAAPLQLQFDPKLLTLVNVDAGEMLGRDGQSVAIVHRDEGNGLVTISVSRPPAVKGIDGQGGVAVLTFRAAAAGDAKLSLARVSAKTSTQATLPANSTPATVHLK